MTKLNKYGTYRELHSEQRIISQTSRQPGPAGVGILVGKDGPQLINSSGKRWSDAAEARFLDHLAASCNVTTAARAAGFSPAALYQRRRNCPAFAQRWQAALEQGYTRIEALLVRRAEEALEGVVIAADVPIPTMTVKDALAILGHHRTSVEDRPRSRRQWARPRSLDELRDSILAKLEAFAPAAATPAAPAEEPR